MPDALGPDIPQFDVPMANLVALVRFFMRDYPELNRLFSGVESGDRMIAWAIIDGLYDFNLTPPFTSFSLTNFPSPDLLLRKAVINLLESIGLLQTRNHLTFSDGGIQVGISDKTPLIQSWIQLFTNSYESKKRERKIALNIEGGWGDGSHSEYLWTNGFYGGW